MCGIAGYLGATELPERRLDACLARMHRRGPDSAAYRHWEVAGRHLYLLSSRLSIIDLDPRANQPFERGALTVSYNGELYNFVELRAELSRDAGPWATASDTEVFTAAVAAWGPDAFSRFEGMWAAAVFDEAAATLTLSRDRFGEKPMYIHEAPDGLYFGSEPKCIAALLGERLRPNVRQLHRFLVNGYRSLYKTRETFFEGITELPPGSSRSIAIETAQSTSTTFWAPLFAPDDDIDYREAVAGVRDRVIRAVEWRLRADVPLAFCMSGGIDSNTLISVARRVCGYSVHGFTIADDDPRYDERAVVDAAVAELGIDHTSVPTSGDLFFERLRALVAYHDAPVHTIAYFAHALLMEQIAAAGYRVAVSGTAADEVFSGYYDHHLAYLAEMRREGDDAGARAAWERQVRPFVRNPFLGDPDLFVRDPGFRDHLFFDADRYAAAMVSPWREPFSERHYTDDLLRNRMLNELLVETVPVILHEDDLNSMYWSIENRSPFLDRALVDFCGTIPTRHLVRAGHAKALLRDAMRGIVPDVVLDNPRKVGFNAPIESFIDFTDQAVRRWLLDKSPIDEHVRRDAVQALLERGGTLPNSDSKFLFYVISARMFLEEFAA